MQLCPKCKGTGEVKSPGWFIIQLYEFGRFTDYLDFSTKEEAITRAIETNWGNKARVVNSQKQVVWHG